MNQLTVARVLTARGTHVDAASELEPKVIHDGQDVEREDTRMRDLGPVRGQPRGASQLDLVAAVLLCLFGLDAERPGLAVSLTYTNGVAKRPGITHPHV